MSLSNTIRATLIFSAALTIGKTNGCDTSPYASCGSDSGISCCPGGQYCQPWNSAFYQCIPTPAKCSQQYTNIDFFGNDIKTVDGLSPGDCCQTCMETKGCTAYTFVNSNPGSTACYLKSGVGENRQYIGAVSGVVSDNNGTTTTPLPTTTTPQPSNTSTPQPTLTPSPTTIPPTTCQTPGFGSCGSDAEVTCCPEDYYCQPWDSNFYQCIRPPSQCTKQFTNIDFVGADIKTINGIQPGDCCQNCKDTAGCKAYTFINSNPGSPVCYLKSEAGAQKAHIGAVSGVLN